MNMDGGSYKPQKFHKNGDDRKIIIHPLYLPKPSPWLDLKIFYVRLRNYEVDDSTPAHLTIKHTSLTPDTILEVNGRRSGMCSDSISCLLRRDRMDRKSEEATFVSTEIIRMTGSVRFDVWDGDYMLLCGVLELRNDEEAKKSKSKWSMRCQTVPTASCCFFDGKIKSSEVPTPIIEVYVAGCVSGKPIILTKKIKLSCQEKHYLKLMPDPVLTSDSTNSKKDCLLKDSQVSGYEDDRSENDTDIEYENLYSNTTYAEGDGQISWFNEGVKVGVGISVGVCLGIGLGVGLLVRTYKATMGNMKRRLF